MLAIAKDTLGSTGGVKNHEFDQEKSIMEFARIVIMHNYPFNMVEHEYLEILFNGLQPMFKLLSRNSVGYDVFQIHKTKKEKLYKYFETFFW